MEKGDADDTRLVCYQAVWPWSERRSYLLGRARGREYLV
jgi:hypothetical protein